MSAWLERWLCRLLGHTEVWGGGKKEVALIRNGAPVRIRRWSSYCLLCERPIQWATSQPEQDWTWDVALLPYPAED